jgi:hypothetical protein
MRTHVSDQPSIASGIHYRPSRRQGYRLGIAALFAVATLSASRQATAQMMGPSAMNDYASVMQDHSVIVNVLSNDFGMPALAPSTVTIYSYPLFGDVAVNPSTGQVMYVPDPDFYGMDGFTYTVADVNGRVSNVASVMIMVMEDLSPPVITSFTGVRVSGNLWNFSGTVSDTELGGNLVTFGGLISGSAITQQDGSFSYRATLPSGTIGNVTAIAVNDEDISSAVVNFYVAN